MLKVSTHQVHTVFRIQLKYIFELIIEILNKKAKASLRVPRLLWGLEKWILNTG